MSDKWAYGQSIFVLIVQKSVIDKIVENILAIFLLLFISYRHSRFGGSFWVKNSKALNPEEELVYHRTLQSEYTPFLLL